jgi:hypothetical protein
MGNVLPGTWLPTSVAEQLSDTAGIAHDAVAWQDPEASTVILELQLAMTGDVVSVTVTWNEQVVLFPAGSVAV